MSDIEAGEKRPRTNAERTATTRGALISAAIECLHRVGYTATSISMIAEVAGISRGAMLHHFPSKVDLMLGVVDNVIAQQRAFYTEELFKLPRGRERFLAITRLTWEAWSKPSGIAIIEIMMAARSDAVLAERLRPLLRDLETNQRADVWALARSAGVTDRATVEASVQLNLAAVRGLCIDLTVRPEREDVHAAFDLLMAYKVATADNLIGEGEASLGETVQAQLKAAPVRTDRTQAAHVDVAEVMADNTRLKRLLADAMLENMKLRERIEGPSP